jgi:hypothetical protein
VSGGGDCYVPSQGRELPLEDCGGQREMESDLSLRKKDEWQCRMERAGQWLGDYQAG